MTSDIVVETGDCDYRTLGLSVVLVLWDTVHFYVAVESFGLTFTITYVKKLFVLKYQSNY